MNNKFYSDDIATCLCRLANIEPTGKTWEDIEEALYSLRAIASNEYNRDIYRVLWNCLQEVAENNQDLIYC